MRFVAIDVETANADIASICQIGVVAFEKGNVVDSWDTLVNPEGAFSPFNTAIHGINEDAVLHAPPFPQVFNELYRRLAHQVVVSHTLFDKFALHQVAKKYGLKMMPCRWLDSTRVIRRAWPEFAAGGYGLKNMAQWLNIPFNHHVALEDARAAGLIVVRAVQETGIGVQEWMELVMKPLAASAVTIERQGNAEGPLAGEVVAFTGVLSISRSKAAQFAAAAGCRVASQVNTRTTVLVVGNQPRRGKARSTAQKKAEALIKRGYALRLVNEEGFFQLLKKSGAAP